MIFLLDWVSHKASKKILGDKKWIQFWNEWLFCPFMETWTEIYIYKHIWSIVKSFFLLQKFSSWIKEVSTVQEVRKVSDLGHFRENLQMDGQEEGNKKFLYRYNEYVKVSFQLLKFKLFTRIASTKLRQQNKNFFMEINQTSLIPSPIYTRQTKKILWIYRKPLVLQQGFRFLFVKDFSFSSDLYCISQYYLS